MQQVVINIKDDTKLNFFLNLIKHLDFVEINQKVFSKEKNNNEDFSEYTELNELTLETLNNSKKGIGVKHHKNLELLYKDLGI